MNQRLVARRRRRPARPRSSSANRGEETRTALLAAARRVFALRGYDGASVRDITREAGVNLGAVTYHFGSKRALYVAVLTDAFSPVVERVRVAAHSPGDPMQRLDAVVDAIFAHLGANLDVPRLMLQEVTTGRRLPRELVAFARANVGNIGSILAAGREDGSLRTGNVAFTALSIVSQPIFMTLVAPLLKEAAGVDLSDPATRSLAAEHVKSFIRDGLAAPREVRA